MVCAALGDAGLAVESVTVEIKQVTISKAANVNKSVILTVSEQASEEGEVPAETTARGHNPIMDQQLQSVRYQWLVQSKHNVNVWN